MILLVLVGAFECNIGQLHYYKLRCNFVENTSLLDDMHLRRFFMKLLLSKLSEIS